MPTLNGKISLPGFSAGNISPEEEQRFPKKAERTCLILNTPLWGISLKSHNLEADAEKRAGSGQSHL